ncbi:MAG: VWA domain-containing protein [Propionibacteriaceae bacterium]
MTPVVELVPMWSLFGITGLKAPIRMLLLLLIPIVVAGYIFAMLRKNKRGMRFTNTSMLEVVVHKQSQWRRHVALALSLLSLITLTFAFSKPVGTVQVPRERATIVVVLDTSLSMQAIDVKPNRLAAAQQAAKAFVLSLPAKYNVALVALWGNPTIVVRPTVDHQAVVRSIDALKLQDSTAIGESIAQALRAVEQAPKDPHDPNSIAPGAIVLLSDGGNTTGRAPDQVATEAKAAKIPIYTIAYGTENGYVDLDGKRETVPVDKAQMERIASQTNGKFFTAATPDQLKTVYQRIGSSVGYEPSEQDVSGRAAGLGLAFAFLAALAAISLAARWP